MLQGLKSTLFDPLAKERKLYERNIALAQEINSTLEAMPPGSLTVKKPARLLRDIMSLPLVMSLATLGAEKFNSSGGG